MKALILLPYPRNRVPGQRYRIEQWLPHLAEMGVESDVVELLSDGDLDRLHAPRSLVRKSLAVLRSVARTLPTLRQSRRRWDVVFVYRTLLPAGPALLERLLAATGLPIVYDFDDAIWVTKTTEANRALSWLKWSGKTASLCTLASHVVVGTELLAEFARRHNRNVTVIPPTVDVDSYRPRRHSAGPGPIVLGWSGSPTTVEYLAVIAGALRRVAAEMPIEVRLMGADFPLPGVRKTFRPWRIEDEVEELRSYDVGLMPLADDPWTRGKGAMKALLYMAVGVPVVASPVGVTPSVVEHGRNGLLAATEDEWVTHLLALARDAHKRSAMGAEGRAAVERWYSPRVQAPRLMEVLRSAAESGRGR
jgi:glycosyltransferase involved in cell wall biosynthesis